MEIGEYIRTDEGKIDKLKEKLKTDKENIDVYVCQKDVFRGNKSITKHSKNLIDLVEVGDIVNGDEVYDITYDDDTEKYFLSREGMCITEESEIKTVLTHEQYEKNCFRVGE